MAKITNIIKAGELCEVFLFVCLESMAKQHQRRISLCVEQNAVVFKLNLLYLFIIL